MPTLSASGRRGAVADDARARASTSVDDPKRIPTEATVTRQDSRRQPTALEHVRRVLAIPFKKTDRCLVPYLLRDELQAILNAPDPTTRDGIRDRAMLHLPAGLASDGHVQRNIDERRV